MYRISDWPGVPLAAHSWAGVLLREPCRQNCRNLSRQKSGVGFPIPNPRHPFPLAKYPSETSVRPAIRVQVTVEPAHGTERFSHRKQVVAAK
jgi:hypothetical protein